MLLQNRSWFRPCLPTPVGAVKGLEPPAGVLESSSDNPAEVASTSATKSTSGFRVRGLLAPIEKYFGRQDVFVPSPPDLGMVSAPQTGIWTKAPTWSYSATVGTVAFLAEPSSKKKKEPDGEYDQMERVFVDISPGLLQLLRSGFVDEQRPAARKTLLSFRLVPAPQRNDSALLAKLPDIFVEYEVDSLSEAQRTAAFNKVSMVLHRMDVDYLSPGHVSDSRYSEQSTIECAAATYNKGFSSELDDWIQQTGASIRGSGRIRPKANLEIQLPRWISAPPLANKAPQGKSVYSNSRPSRAHISAEKEQQRQAQLALERTIKAHYMFASVEHREVIPFEFQGFNLLYTSREGGKIGGRGGSFTLQHKTDEWCTPMKKAAREKRKDFIKASFLLSKLMDDAVRGRLASKSSAKGIESHAEETVEEEEDLNALEQAAA